MMDFPTYTFGLIELEFDNSYTFYNVLMIRKGELQCQLNKF
jgi:hypothetical protein